MNYIFIFFALLFFNLPIYSVKAVTWYDKELTPSQQQVVESRSPQVEPLDFKNLNDPSNEPAPLAEPQKKEVLNDSFEGQLQAEKPTVQVSSPASKYWLYVLLVFAICGLVVYLVYLLRPKQINNSDNE